MARPVRGSVVTRWAAASDSACCSSRSTLNSSATIGASGSPGAAGALRIDRRSIVRPPRRSRGGRVGVVSWEPLPVAPPSPAPPSDHTGGPHRIGASIESLPKCGDLAYGAPARARRSNCQTGRICLGLPGLRHPPFPELLASRLLVKAGEEDPVIPDRAAGRNSCEFVVNTGTPTSSVTARIWKPNSTSRMISAKVSHSTCA